MTTFKIQTGKFLSNISVDLTRTATHYVIRSPYNAALVEELRALRSGKWQPGVPPQGGHWIVPITDRNNYALAYLQGHRHTFPPMCRVNNFQRKLFKHQEEGINFALSRKRCILAFEMGLGKTLLTIEVMERSVSAESGAASRLQWWLVAPFGAQMEWLRQLRRWQSSVYPTVITTYESLHKHMEKADEPPFGVIFDESVKIKNPNARRSCYAAELCRLVRQNSGSYIILLSGAPAPKEPVDWWHQCECIFPGWIREGDKFKFIRRYAYTELQDHGYGQFQHITGWNEEEVRLLGRRLSPLVLVKHKKDCFDMPDKIFDPIHCHPNESTLKVARILAEQAPSGAQALENLRELSDGFQYTTDAEGVKTTKFIGSPKLTIIKELLDFYHTENGGPGRLVIYAAFHASVDMLTSYAREHDWTTERIDGRGWSNPNILEKFDDESVDNYCIVCNSGCVYGLNFARTECLCYYSNSFNPDYRIQSLERRDRPGMDTAKGTRIVDLINLNTDQMILDRLNERLGVQSITIEEIKKCLTQD